MENRFDYKDLTPELILNSVEEATGQRMTGLILPLPSYINRVYELEAENGTRLIAKFYRPGRWTAGALNDEHRFILDCAEADIPVVAPIRQTDGNTIRSTGGINFSLFPKKHGRELEINSSEDWKRIGMLIGRIHLAGTRRNAETRIRLHPERSLASDIDQLISGGFIPEPFGKSLRQIGDDITEISSGLFDEMESIRIHGDCHRKNVICRPDDGMMVIDFDDMMTGPPVQDLWLLLPGRASECRNEINLLLQGYETFKEFDDRSLRLIEPLRAMRIIYFLAWCSRQVDDYQFRSNFPDWGSDDFWRKEICDLKAQVEIIRQEAGLHNSSNFNISQYPS